MTQSKIPAIKLTQENEPAERKTVGAREQLDHLYRAIGISAVAAAAAQVARPERKSDAPKHAIPACLRDDDDEIAA